MTSSSVVLLLNFIYYYHLFQKYLHWILHPLNFHVLWPGFLHNHQFHLENHWNHESSHWYHLYSIPYFKTVEVFLFDYFSTSGIVSSFYLLLGLTGSWIVSFPLIKVSAVFFLFFLQGMCCWSEVTLDTLSICLDKTEIPKSSFLISICDSFSILVLFSDRIVFEIDPDVFYLLTVFSVSIIWVYLDLSNDLTFSD